MNKYIVQVTLSLSLLITLASCGPKISEDQRAQLGKLEDSVKAVAATFNTIDSAEIQKMANTYYSKRDFFLNDMKDTLAPEMALTISHYMMIKKAMAYLRDSYTPLSNETVAMLEQLENLSHDIDKRLIDSKGFEQYYQLELDNYNKMRDAVNRLKLAYHVCKQRIDSLDSQLDSIVVAYKQEHNEDPS